MYKEIRLIDQRPAGDLRFLLCDPTGEVDLSATEGQWACSLIQCLDRAVEESPAVIAVRFAPMPIREREAWVELCVALKRNRHTRDCAVVALLHAPHRRLLESLRRADVDYARIVGDAGLDASRMRGIIQGLGEQDRLERHLSVLCPSLHYQRIDAQRELITCGAYRDRMVLGGRRLLEICQTGDHLHCEYALHPRPRS